MKIRLLRKTKGGFSVAYRKTHMPNHQRDTGPNLCSHVSGGRFVLYPRFRRYFGSAASCKHPDIKTMVDFTAGCCYNLGQQAFLAGILEKKQIEPDYSICDEHAALYDDFSAADRSVESGCRQVFKKEPLKNNGFP